MIKSISFTTMHFSIAFAVAWMLTGDWAVGGMIALVEPAVNSVGYVFHERIWERVKRGEPLWAYTSKKGIAV